MQTPAQPENARAFNTWLVDNWLQEANYPYDNVAVWDFYTVLTDENNHHMFSDGQVLYIHDQGGNTLAYPSSPEDDHPSQAGNQKAAEEFVPMLNVFYNRWHSSAQNENQTEPEPTQAEQPAAENPAPQATAIVPGGTFDSFGSNQNFWECFSDEGAEVSITCNIDAFTDPNPGQGLHIVYAIAPQSWATTIAFFSEPMNVEHTGGLALTLRSPQGPAVFNVVVYHGDDENRETYLYPMQLVAGSDWQQVAIRWQDFKRAEWESADQESLIPGQISGIGFGLDGTESEANNGELWIDEISWLTTDSNSGNSVTQTQPVSEQAEPSDTENQNAKSRPFFCPGSGFFLIAVLAVVLGMQRLRGIG